MELNPIILFIETGGCNDCLSPSLPEARPYKQGDSPRLNPL